MLLLQYISEDNIILLTYVAAIVTFWIKIVLPKEKKYTTVYESGELTSCTITMMIAF